jgi:hypothetical protein
VCGPPICSRSLVPSRELPREPGKPPQVTSAEQRLITTVHLSAHFHAVARSPPSPLPFPSTVGTPNSTCPWSFPPSRIDCSSASPTRAPLQQSFFVGHRSSSSDPNLRRVERPIPCASQLPQAQLRSEPRRMVLSRTTIGRAFPNSTTTSVSTNPSPGPLITTSWTVQTASASLGSPATRR